MYNKYNGVHNDGGTRLYKIYCNIIRRVENPKCKTYEHYGKRGIKICDLWRNDFSEFKKWSEINGYSDGLTIDRIDVNGDYTPNNCKWSTVKEQMSNTTRTRYAEHNGVTKTIHEWSKELSLPYNRITYLMDNYGLSFEQAIQAPTDKNLQSSMVAQRKSERLAKEQANRDKLWAQHREKKKTQESELQAKRNAKLELRKRKEEEELKKREAAKPHKTPKVNQAKRVRVINIPATHPPQPDEWWRQPT